MKNLSLSDEQLKIVLAILKKYPYAFYAYGSRTQGKSRQTSDLDICFIESIPLNVQSHIEEDFEESSLPFCVEVSDYNLMTEEFQMLIKNDLVTIQNNRQLNKQE